MAQIFSKTANKAPLITLAAVLLAGVFGIFLLYYLGSPRNTDVGYRPDQPVAYSHKLHAGDLAIDCRYCHWAVDRAAHANVPSTKTCMNCHEIIGTENDKLLPVRESWAMQIPIEWVRVHKTPDYAYFDHAAHVTRGVGCNSCHGNVANMIKVMQVEPHSMKWCLECHRNPDPHLRPVSQVTNMNWVRPSDHAEFVAKWKQEKQIQPPVDCSGCHR